MSEILETNSASVDSALQEAEGNMERAVDILREKGISQAFPRFIFTPPFGLRTA